MPTPDEINWPNTDSEAEAGMFEVEGEGLRERADGVIYGSIGYPDGEVVVIN